MTEFVNFFLRLPKNTPIKNYQTKKNNNKQDFKK